MLQTKTVEPRTLDILKQIMSIDDLNPFVLVGGTGLSLQYGHRISIDLDFFGPVEKLDEPLISEHLKSIGNTVLVVNSKVMLGYFVDNLKIDFVKYNYPFIRPILNEEGIRIADPLDIGAMKLAAITGRGKRKDFTDLYYLLHHYTIKELFQAFNEKYIDGNIMLVYRSLTYFEDAEEDDEPEIFDSAISWNNIKKYIKKKYKLFLEETE